MSVPSRSRGSPACDHRKVHERQLHISNCQTSINARESASASELLVMPMPLRPACVCGNSYEYMNTHERTLRAVLFMVCLPLSTSRFGGSLGHASFSSMHKDKLPQYVTSCAAGQGATVAVISTGALVREQCRPRHHLRPSGRT